MTPTPPDDGLTVILSDRIGEIDPALRLVHDGFVESGFMVPTPSGRRVVPHYLTPGTAFALTLRHGELIAVCSCIPDGPYGLPSEGDMPEEIATARGLGTLVEVGSLVVAREHRALSRRAVLMMLMAHLRRLVHQSVADVGLCTVAPEQARFYQSALGMQVIGSERLLYGVPAVLLGLDLKQMADYVIQPGGILRRVAGELYSDPDPLWLESRVGTIGRRTPPLPTADGFILPPSAPDERLPTAMPR